jgi:hypothetical protein
LISFIANQTPMKNGRFFLGIPRLPKVKLVIDGFIKLNHFSFGFLL